MYLLDGQDRHSYGFKISLDFLHLKLLPMILFSFCHPMIMITCLFGFPCGQELAELEGPSVGVESWTWPMLFEMGNVSIKLFFLLLKNFLWYLKFLFHVLGYLELVY